MIRALTVFCSSSDAVDPRFIAAAREFGTQLGTRRHDLVFGGATVGLMGAVARAAQAAGARVTGVVPQAIVDLGIAFTAADELVVTRDLRERKGEMDRRGDAFVALPGGIGTLEELAEVLTLKQLALHRKPIVLLDTDGFWRPLIDLFEHMYSGRFAAPATRELYHVAATPAAVFEHLATYRPPRDPSRWLHPEGRVLAEAMEDDPARDPPASP